MSPPLHPLIPVSPATATAHCSVRDLLHAQAPDRLAVVDSLMTHAPHVLPAAVSGRGLDLQRLDECMKDLTLEGLPAAIQRASRSRQLSYLGGRLCAESALLESMGRYDPIAIGEGGAPCWPVGMTGSIAHTRCAAWAVAGRLVDGLRLGIDSECMVDGSGARDIVALCCTPWERARWFDSIDPMRATLLFSAKESVYKAIHPLVQRFVDFDEMEMIDCIPTADAAQHNVSTIGAIATDAASAWYRLRMEATGPLASEIAPLIVYARMLGNVVHTAVAHVAR